MSFLRRLCSGGSNLVELGQDEVVSVLGTTSASATYRIDANVGTYSAIKVGNVNTTTTFKWGRKGDFAGYYVRATLVSGTNPTGTMGSWQQTNGNRTWSNSVTTGQSLTSVIKIELSNKSDGSVILDSHLVTLDANCP